LSYIEAFALSAANSVVFVTEHLIVPLFAGFSVGVAFEIGGEVGDADVADGETAAVVIGIDVTGAVGFPLDCALLETQALAPRTTQTPIVATAVRRWRVLKSVLRSISCRDRNLTRPHPLINGSSRKLRCVRIATRSTMREGEGVRS
jgi:hypothetical protein